MKALTIYQPWATLIAIGAKHIETRSWSTKYRGPLAVHAGKVLDHEVYGFRFVKTAVKRRIIRNHMSLQRLKAFLLANDLSRVKQIWLLHLSADNSEMGRFKREIQALTGKEVYVA